MSCMVVDVHEGVSLDYGFVMNSRLPLDWIMWIIRTLRKVTPKLNVYCSLSWYMNVNISE